MSAVSCGATNHCTSSKKRHIIATAGRKYDEPAFSTAPQGDTAFTSPARNSIVAAVFEQTSVFDHELSCTSGALGRVDRPSFHKMIGRMLNTEDHRCPNCDSTDLFVIDTKAISDELLECLAVA